MSFLLDETAADVPVRDIMVGLSRLTAAPPDSSVFQHNRARQDISQVSREELEDRFLRVSEETLQLKQHIHRQDDKIKKLGTKLMRLVKDRGRMEQLVAGGAPPASKVRDVEMEEMMEELQEKVRALQAENEGLKQRLLLAKQQLINSQSRRPSPYGHIQSRVNSGMKKLRDDALSLSPARPRSMRSLDGGGKPPPGQLPRYGHSLLEEARAEIRNLENMIESQRNQMEELEGASERLKEELRRKEAEYEEALLEVREQQTSTLRSQVNNNVSMIKLQKQLAVRSTAVTELEQRFLQLQQAQQTLKVAHDAAMSKVDELSAQLKDERLKRLDLEKQLQTMSITKSQMEQLQDRISELDQEKELLSENNKKLLDRAFDVSPQQKWQLQEQHLKLQISQLETALKADLVDKNKILDQIKAEREEHEKLVEDHQKLQIQYVEQKQHLEELKNQIKIYSRETDYSVAELTEALLLVKKRKSQRSGDLGFLEEEEEESSIRELRAAHAETIQELEKTRNLLTMESRISQDYKAELDAALQKIKRDKDEYDRTLERQVQLLDARAAKISKLEAQLRDVTYRAFRPDLTARDEADQTPHLEPGENLLELHIASATLSPPALQVLGDAEPSTFCTYSFYRFELHSTSVVTGHHPEYGFTSRYVVTVDQDFLEYLNRCSVTVELHQALGLDWRTLASGQLELQQLLEQEGKVHGSMALVGAQEQVQSFGSLDYWLRLKIPITEKIRLHPELTDQNQLFITVQRCTELGSRCSQQPSPYVVYKFFSFPDHPTTTVQDHHNPTFHDLRSYPVLMDADLDRYLKSEVLQFYVFDYKEMDTYLGKTQVPLLPLAHNQVVSGVFPLADPSGLPAGHIEVTLRWKFTYLCPPGSIMAAEETGFTSGEKSVEEAADLTPQRQLDRERQDAAANSPTSTAPLPKLRGQKRRDKDTRRVTFIESTSPDHQLDEQISAERRTTLPPVQVLPKAPTEEEDDEEESHVSEGQLVPQSFSDDSDISEEITADVEEAPADYQRESAQSDSDDCIVQGPAAGRKPSDRVRVEVVSLSLTPLSRLALDDSVVRLFVEYSFLDLPTEETPLSLPKPPQGRSINYNYSKVIPVDAEENAARRRLLKEVLEGRNPHMERIRFTVVSEPPEEEEQERECEDVGVAFLRIPEILEKQQDLMEARLSVLDVDDSSKVLGSLTVTLEGLEALRAIMEERDCK
ncbi:protein fantom [Melanotaenia boesemani]|uniref:protein fantom n=1 Tax=Melanotaenia boesemani TaxID=1250792 RepID=UPI001C04E088|nr:protein fantom [Melanotaenia boesemani]